MLFVDYIQVHNINCIGKYNKYNKLLEEFAKKKNGRETRKKHILEII